MIRTPQPPLPGARGSARFGAEPAARRRTVAAALLLAGLCTAAPAVLGHGPQGHGHGAQQAAPPQVETQQVETPPQAEPGAAAESPESREAAAAAAGPARRLDWPSPDVGVDALAARAAAQRWRRDELKVPADFRFTDRRAESGIDFEHGIPEEGGKHWLPVHYDHGSPVVAADVDGDGFPDLYFVNLVGANALWRNRGDGTFEDWTGRAGVGVADRVSMAASFADVDNDGDPDLFVTTVRGGNLLFLNDGTGRFTEAPGGPGRELLAHSSTGTFFDYDRDGRLDLLLTNVGRFTDDVERPGGAFGGLPDAFQGHLHPDRAERHRLYRNLGEARFEDVSDATGFVDASWSGDASPVDFDGDLEPDLYLTNMQGDDRYWENRGGRWVERTDDFFPKTPWGTMGIKFFDYDRDGDLDLLLTDMHSDMSQEVPPAEEKAKSEMLWPDDQLQGGANNIFGNAFYRNLGDGRFEEVSDALGLENYWPWGVSVADVNADGWEDVLITASMSYPFRYGVNSLLLNNRAASFVEAEFLLGIEPRAETKVPWFEIDCGGDPGPDGAPRAGADREYHMCTGRDGRWTVWGNLGTRGAVVLDLDGDGDLDVVTNEFNARPQVLISDLAQRGTVRWLKVRLVGTRSNRDGLGAHVRVTAGGATQTRYHDGKSGYMAQSSLPLYIGLGEATAVERIEVRWPSGAVQEVSEGLGINRLIEIVEPLAEPEPTSGAAADTEGDDEPAPPPSRR
jgi:enediyne biosynthesis protein E4